MKLKYYTVDAFTTEVFGGNPAAVLPMTQKLEEDALQKLASEFNLSETTYLVPLCQDKVGDEIFKICDKYSLRWFTPTKEVPLCGHATLATAHVLFHCYGNKSDKIEFETLSGTLVARRNGDYIILDFPLNPPKPLTNEQKDSLKEVLAEFTNNCSVTDVSLAENKKMIVRLDDSSTRATLEALKVNTQRLESLHDGSIVRGVIVTLLGGKGSKKNPDDALRDYHFVSRYFAPWMGIPEDPVTGSAHTVLGPYWADVLNTNTFECRQCSTRGGDLRVAVRGDGRVDLAGRAVLVTEGVVHV